MRLALDFRLADDADGRDVVLGLETFGFAETDRLLGCFTAGLVRFGAAPAAGRGEGLPTRSPFPVEAGSVATLPPADVWRAIFSRAAFWLASEGRKLPSLVLRT